MGTKNYDSATDMITFSRASGGTALRRVGSGTELASQVFADWTATASTLTDNGNGTWNLTDTDGGIGYINDQLTGLTVGNVYQVTSTVTNNTTSGSLTLQVGTSAGASQVASDFVNADTNGTITFQFVASATAHFLGFRASAFVAGDGFDFTPISVKEVIFDVATDPLVLFNHPDNIPRIEYDAAGVVKGLLVEEQGTNLVKNSSNFGSSQWIKGNLDIASSSAGGESDPAAETAAHKIVTNTANTEHRIYYNVVTSTASRSVYAKAGTANYMCITAGTTASGYAVFNLSSGQIESQSNITDALIEDVGNGWYRCSIVGGIVSTYIVFNVGTTANNAVPQVTWTGAGEYIYLWGAQAESTGSFASSYIPTSGNAATRAADIASIPTSAFGYNSGAGTVVVEFDSAKLTNSGIYSLYADSSNGITSLVYPSNRVSYQVVDGGALQVNDNFADYNVSGQTSKVATTYSNNDFAAVLDGGAVSSDTGGSVPAATNIVLGNYLGTGSSFQMSGHIKSIQYYPRRLSNAQLQELTT